MKNQRELPLCHGCFTGVSSCSGALQDGTRAAGTNKFVVTSYHQSEACWSFLCPWTVGNSISEVEMRTVSRSQLRTAMPRQELISSVPITVPYRKSSTRKT